ncbi:hypothetical protein AB1Y20_005633 [Prymnesium parvum]|uniref:tRNA:m(4)X modification enzyme TRM13 n=1 Tax=Prymnesium parvum TaxID=97485 RepID=A0AB34J776_PRYPA
MDRPPSTESCALWLPSKKRQCHFPRVGGFEYCGHHLASRGEAEAASVRVPCPLDPRHSVFERELHRHLRRCPKAKEAAAMAALPCYRQDANAPPVAAAAAAAPRGGGGAGGAIHHSLGEARGGAPLGAAGVARLAKLCERVASAHAACGESVRREEGGEGGGGGGGAEKHRVQNEAIVRAMGRVGAVRARAVHMEVGAGKGKLAAVVSEACPLARYVLVDWAKPHGAADKEMEARGVAVRRYKLDLRHLWLRGLSEWGEDEGEGEGGEDEGGGGGEREGGGEGGVDAHGETGGEGKGGGEVGGERGAEGGRGGGEALWRSVIGKHLCGAATDFALRSVVGALPEEGRRGVVNSVAIATCCHHKCTWPTYVNPAFLQGLGFDEADFQLLVLMSSWATAAKPACSRAPANGSREKATGEVGEADGRDEEGEHGAADAAAAELGNTLRDVLSEAERVAVGWQCKRLLDSGRQRFLEAHGYRAWQEQYVDSQVSPENVLLLATYSGVQRKS